MSEPKFPPRPTGPHPTPEQLYLAAAAERSGAWTPADEEAFAHAAACAECSAEIARLEAFAEPSPVAPEAIDAAWESFRHRAGAPSERIAPPAPARRATIVPFPAAPLPRPAAPSPWRYAAWAAAAMLAVGLGLGFFLGTTSVQTVAPIRIAEGSRPPVPAPSPGDDVLRGGDPTAPSAGELAPTGAVDLAPTEIRFANPDHEPKRVLLFSTEPPYQWQSPETTASRIELPAAERAKLKPGIDYFWSVLDSDGESAARTFRLRPR